MNIKKIVMVIFVWLFWLLNHHRRAMRKRQTISKKKCEDHDRTLRVFEFFLSCFYSSARTVTDESKPTGNGQCSLALSKNMRSVIEAIKTVRLHFMSPQALVSWPIQLAAASSLFLSLRFSSSQQFNYPNWALRLLQFSFGVSSSSVPTADFHHHTHSHILNFMTRYSAMNFESSLSSCRSWKASNSSN